MLSPSTHAIRMLWDQPCFALFHCEGLSLALMENNLSTNCNEAIVRPESHLEIRRAALHHAPPHQRQAPKAFGMNEPSQTMGVGGDYGYAYNNHISWQEIRPSSNLPISLPGKKFNEMDDEAKLCSHWLSQRGRLSSSPTSLAGTPPSGAFLSKVAGGGAMTQSPTLVHAASFASQRIPSPAPPFPSRSPGFVHAEPIAASSSETKHAQHPNEVHNQKPTLGGALSPMTTFDHLHRSPFRHGASGHGASGLSSLSIMGSLDCNDSTLPPSLSDTAVIFAPSPLGRVKEGADDDMPFAVDMEATMSLNMAVKNLHRELQPNCRPSTNPGFESLYTVNNGPSISNNGFATSDSLSIFASSAASFAQKCVPAQHRLKLFALGPSGDTGTLESPAAFGDIAIGGEDSILALQQQQKRRSCSAAGAARLGLASSSFPRLSSQLTEFHNFGASNSLIPEFSNQHQHAPQGCLVDEEEGPKKEELTY